jgi:RNA polymerase sigma-70 factor (ECF subfamily)
VMKREAGVQSQVGDEMTARAVPARQERPCFREIYEGEVSWVYHRLRRLGVNEADLEDTVHDVFVVVHRRLADYDPSRPLRPWIAGITVRVAADHFKRAHRRHEVLRPDLEPVAGPHPHHELEARQRQRLLQQMLDRLDPDRRAVVVLHDLEGFSMPEVAEMLEVGVNTLYSRLRLAREQLASDVSRLKKTGVMP